MKFRRRPEVIEAVQWWPPGDSHCTPIPGVEKGPREDQGWGFWVLRWGAVDRVRTWRSLLPGDWVRLDERGQACEVIAPRVMAQFEPVND